MGIFLWNQIIGNLAHQINMRQIVGNLHTGFCLCDQIIVRQIIGDLHTGFRLCDQIIVRQIIGNLHTGIFGKPDKYALEEITVYCSSLYNNNLQCGTSHCITITCPYCIAMNTKNPKKYNFCFFFFFSQLLLFFSSLDCSVPSLEPILHDG